MAKADQRPMISCGSQVVSGGHSVIAMSTANSGASQGTIARAIASKEMFAT